MGKVVCLPLMAFCSKKKLFGLSQRKKLPGGNGFYFWAVSPLSRRLWCVRRVYFSAKYAAEVTAAYAC